MSNAYTRIANMGYKDLKLKPMLCEKCRLNGNMSYGECPTCLHNYAYNKDYLETHTFLTDTELRGYHDCSHEDIKSIPLHLPTEQPLQYYGIEIEVTFDDLDYDDGYYDDDDEYHETSSELNEIVEESLRILGGLAVAEEDCTVPNGAEFIFRAMSYRYAMQPETYERLKKWSDYLRAHGASIHQREGNGMHVHISKTFFRNNLAEGASNFDWLFQKFQPEIEQLGSRHYTEYSRSTVDKMKNNIHLPTHEGLSCKAEYTYTNAIHPLPTDHGSSIIESGNTLEVRVFRSTILPDQILANIELVRAFAHAAREGATKGRTLNDILHSKDTRYLDVHIQKTRMKSPKAPLDLNVVDDNTIKFTLERSN